MTARSDDTDRLWAALGDPMRMRLLDLLLEYGEATASTLAAALPITRQGVSKHLAVLERARLIEKRRQGRLSICSLNPKPLEEIAGWAEGFRESWEANYRRLDALLDELRTRETKRERPKRKPQEKRGDRR